MGMLFTILFFIIFGRMIGFAFRMTWGLFKVLLYIVFLPLILLLMVFGGLIYIALPLLIIVGVLSLITNA
ncbi:MAG: hypothetical protein K5883_07525 [Pseudobutyrivibrio sp.]|nr:hypothetical protein [Pseudobutyrivibrio sp.]